MPNFFLISVYFLFCGLVAAQNISTIAGGGPRNISALQTGLPQPSGIVLDAQGNVYFSVAQANQVWKINTSGQVNVFAGNGTYLFNGDGGQATGATLYQPQGLVFDSLGNLYIADSSHNRVRMVNTSGLISTFAGTGAAGFSGDGGPATAAALSNPVSLAFDSSNNLYIADQGNHRVRMVSSSGIITTAAGNGTASFAGDGGGPTSASLSSPNSVAVNSTGIYIADAGNFRIRKVAPSGTPPNSPVITTIAGTGVSGNTGDNGPAASATLNTLSNLTFDRFGNLYIAEAYDIREIASGSSNIVSFAGTGSTPGYSGDGGSPSSATFRNIASLAFDANSANLYIADSGNNRVRKASSSTVTTFAGNGTLDFNGDGQSALNANFLTPNTLATDNAGSLLLADVGSSSIRKVALSTGILSTAAGSGFSGLTPDGGSVTGPLNNPFALTFDASGALYFIEANRIRKVVNAQYTTIGNTANTPGFTGDGGPATSAQFSSPAGLAVAANGDVYVADTQNNRVRLISAQTGYVTTIAGTGAGTSTGDNGLATSASLNYPSALSLDGGGNLFVAELLGNRIRKINLASNVISTAAGDGTSTFADGGNATSTGLSVPFGVFADQSDNLFIADQGHSRVRKVTAATGLISTVAGNGTYDFEGDGGLATSAAVNPIGLTVDRAQNLYIADSSGRVRTTTVSACFFTVSSSTFYISKSGGSGSVTFTATNPNCPYTITSGSAFVTITGSASGTGGGTVTFTVAADPGATRSATLNIGGQTFNVSQTGALAQTNVGTFQPNAPFWALDANGNGVYDPNSGDRFFAFAGQPGAIAVVGDWNGDGRSKVGYYINGFWVLDYNGNGVYDGPNGGDRFYGYGNGDPSYIPVVGDWNGNGRTKVGFYHNGFWVLDANGDGTFNTGDYFYGYGGQPGDMPIVGDWNGDGRTKVGVYNNANNVWQLDYNGDGTFNTGDKYYLTFANLSNDKPVVGDWSGDGKTKIGVFRSGFWVLDYNGNGTYDGTGANQDKFYAYGGDPTDVPIVGDWSGDGKSKIGVYRGGFWVLDFNGNGTYDAVGTVGGDRFIGYYGGTGSQPLLGRW